jgi:hypothetical protein
MNSPERRRNVVSDWMSFVMSSMALIPLKHLFSFRCYQNSPSTPPKKSITRASGIGSSLQYPTWRPEIAAVTPVTPQPHEPNLTPTPFPQSLVNIVNPPAAPDPTGLAAALNVLGTPNIFRDMSGRAEVADLLKRLSDNTIGIAEAANRAQEIQARYGGSGFALGSGTRGGLGGPGARPTEASRVARSLQDLRNELKRGFRDGFTSPEAAEQLYAIFLASSFGPVTWVLRL